MFLLHYASGIKGIKIIAVTISTPYMFEEETARVSEYCNIRGIDHIVIRMDIPSEIRNNPVNRCYLCKKKVFSHIAEVASENGFDNIYDGTNADDINDYRPGLKALQEAGILSPLMEAGLTKDEIREFSKREGLITWDKPANTCLLTRFPHDITIDERELRKTEEAEVFLSDLGLSGSRVRVHDDLVRIELRKENINAALVKKTRENITAKMKELGYKYITLDLEGYVSGRMNKKS